MCKNKNKKMIALEHNIKENILLKDYTTFKIGGQARFFVEVDDLQRLAGVLKWAQECQQKIFVLGGGSNLLFMDEGFDGLIIKIINQNIKVEIKNESAVIKCDAGVKLSQLIATAFKNNLTGLEWAIGIPGTVGGAIRGNAGAFGGEIKDVVQKVRAINIKAHKKTKNDCLNKIIYPNEITDCFRNSCNQISQNFNNQDCDFGYRASIFKENIGLIVWNVEFKLKIGNGKQSKNTAEKFLQQRQSKQPNVTKCPSAGSVFKNPIVSETIQAKFKDDTGIDSKNNKVPAGWLIKRCDLLGQKIGGAKISDEHGNFIINTGKATAKDIILLISIIKTKVRNKYKVTLQEEICIVH